MIFKSITKLLDQLWIWGGRARPGRPAEWPGASWLAERLDLGALAALAGSIWLQTNAPSMRLAKKTISLSTILPRRCLLRSLWNVSSCLKSNVFGRFQTYMDGFGHVWICSDVFGWVWKCSDTFSPNDSDIFRFRILQSDFEIRFWQNQFLTESIQQRRFYHFLCIVMSCDVL